MLDSTSTTLFPRFPAPSALRESTSRVFPILAKERSAPGSALHGRCPVCGSLTAYVDFTDNERESGSCQSCSSFNRQRQLAYLLRQQLELPQDGPITFPHGFSVFNTETTGAVHRALAGHPGYVGAEYFGPENASGSLIGGVRHEDLRSLSFADGSLDLVLSSDVLEHVPDPYAAHREIFRVLKPGGRHLFTVPFWPWLVKDDVRAKEVNGQAVHLADPLYHGDPVRPGEGILVWTIFGLEMLVRLADIGFEPSAWSLYEPSAGIVGTWSIVFEALKPLTQKEPPV